MKELIESIFGAYEPLKDGFGTYITGLSGIDFGWIFGAILYCMVFSAFLKILFYLIRGRS